MRYVALALLAACSSSSPPCPTAEQLATGSDDPRELAIIVEQCRANHWPASVTRCLRQARAEEAQEACFKQLSADHQKRLRDAFAPLYAEHDKANVEKDTAAFVSAFETSGLIPELVARAPTCDVLRTDVELARKRLLACAQTDSLELYGLSQQLIGQLRDASKLPDDQLADACKHVAILLADAKCR
jgi:hypothetical protein